MKLEFKGFYDKGLFVIQKKGTGSRLRATNRGAKKRYALIRGKALTIRGFEAVRSDWCAAAREMQQKILLSVLMGKKEEGLKTARDYISNMRSKKTKKKDTILTTVISRSLKKYKAKAPHIEAAKQLQEGGKKIEFGSKVSYIITEGEKSPGSDKSLNKKSISDRAVPASKVKGRGYDADYYINNQLVPAALRVLSEFGYDEKDLK